MKVLIRRNNRRTRNSYCRYTLYNLPKNRGGKKSKLEFRLSFKNSEFNSSQIFAHLRKHDTFQQKCMPRARTH